MRKDEVVMIVEKNTNEIPNCISRAEFHIGEVIIIKIRLINLLYP